MRLTRLTLTEVSRTVCAATSTVAAPDPSETQFVLDHIAKLTPERGNRAAFAAGSAVPADLAAMLAARGPSFETASQNLAQTLHARMASTSRATPCILAVAAVARGTGAADTIAVLKLDMDQSGADVGRDASGRVTRLRLMTQLLPQPGKLSKAVLWPDPAGGQGAYVRDATSNEPAAYFPAAYDLAVGTTVDKAESALVELVRAEPVAAVRSAALAALHGHAGTVGTALQTLRRANITVPAVLPPDLADPGTPVRAARVLRRQVILQADWLTVTVPIQHEDDVDVVDNHDGTWTVTATVGARPARTVK